MNEIIKKYPIIKQDEDIVYCSNLAYQIDMSSSVEYGRDYFDKYIKMEGKDIAIKINKTRVELTEKYCLGPIIDIGIGSGEFIKSSSMLVYGFDINPYGEAWLRGQKLFLNPYEEPTGHVSGWTFWDTLEHIPDPIPLFNKIKSGDMVFLSIPIFRDILKIKENKHYRPNEHYYYFSVQGMIQYMQDLDFAYIEHNFNETESGREDIGSFVFKR